MTYAEMERTMQFLLEQQAQLTANVQRHDEQIAEVNEQIAQLTANVQRHDGHIGQVTDLVGRLAQAEIRLVERMTDLEGRMAELATAGKETQERLDAFITFVEKYISGRNGGRRRKNKSD